eukprot:2640049-Lingulodinium_polyedra.AAC.1
MRAKAGGRRCERESLRSWRSRLGVGLNVGATSLIMSQSPWPGLAIERRASRSSRPEGLP